MPKKNTCKDKRAAGRKNAIVGTELTHDARMQVWASNRTQATELRNDEQPIPCSPCHIWCGPTQNGYPAISRGHERSKFKVHIFAAYSRFLRFPRSHEVSSHLCHRKLCINPEHLCYESIADNNWRKGCLRAMIHHGDVINLCSHTPRCIRRDTDTVGINFQPERTYVIDDHSIEL